MNDTLDVPAATSLTRKLAQVLDAGELDGLDFPDRDKNGNPIVSQANIIHFLDRCQVQLWHDDFSLRTYVRGVPGETILNDSAFDDLYIALDLLGLRVTKDFLWSFLRSYSRNMRTHPVRQHLEGLEKTWDGKPRLDSWLTDYCGVEDTPYSRAVAAKWMIAAVRRVRQPGCKFDFILIFEGPQGIGKSTVFRRLAYDTWFTDNLTIGLEQKEIIELARGKWICELAELTNIGKHDVESIKTFAARQTDEARMAYGHETVQFHRQFVLAATTNRARYLRDESGDRRFWMVETKGVVNSGQPGLPPGLDVDGLERDRDQLWAEAAVREARGEEIFLPPQIEVLARAEQLKRYDVDERQELLEDLLKGKSGFVPSNELYEALGLTEKRDRHPGNSKLVANAMVRLGWTSERQRIGSRQLRGWQSPDGSEDVLKFHSKSGMVAMPRDHYNQETSEI